MTGNEQMLNILLKPHLLGQVSRMENAVGVGCPDIHSFYQGKDYWIELKCHIRHYDGGMIFDKLRPSQQLWHLKRVKQKGIVYCIVRVGNEITVYRSMDVRRVIEAPIERYYVHYERIFCEVKPWDWRDFQRALYDV